MKSIKIITVFCIVLLFVGCTKTPKNAANDWLIEQSDFVETIEIASTSISDLFSLYLIDAISMEDFSAELFLLKAQLNIAKMEFTNKQSEIAINSYSFASKCGIEAITSAYRITIDFLNDSLQYFSDKKYILNKYIIWRRDLTKETATYYTAKQLIEEVAKDD